MFEYFVQLEREFQLPVLPIGLLLQVGLNGIGWDVHELHFWDHRVLRFEYAYVGLPALDAKTYLGGEQILGVALSTLMKVPAQRRAELYAEGLQRIVTSGENDYRQYLLAECLEAYSDLDEGQKSQLDELLESESNREGKKLVITTSERARLADRRESLLLLLETRFGELSETSQRQIEEMTAEQLREAMVAFAAGRSLEQWGIVLETDEQQPNGD